MTPLELGPLALRVQHAADILEGENLDALERDVDHAVRGNLAAAALEAEQRAEKLRKMADEVDPDQRARRCVADQEALEEWAAEDDGPASQDDEAPAPAPVPPADPPAPAPTPSPPPPPDPARRPARTERRTRQRREVTEEKVLEALHQGAATAPEIAQRVGLTPKAARVVLARLGGETPPRVHQTGETRNNSPRGGRQAPEWALTVGTTLSRAATAAKTAAALKAAAGQPDAATPDLRSRLERALADANGKAEERIVRALEEETATLSDLIHGGALPQAVRRLEENGVLERNGNRYGLARHYTQ